MQTILPVEIIQPRWKMWWPSLIAWILWVLTPLGAYYLGIRKDRKKIKEERKSYLKILNILKENLMRDIYWDDRSLIIAMRKTYKQISTDIRDVEYSAIAPTLSYKNTIQLLNHNEITKHLTHDNKQINNYILLNSLLWTYVNYKKQYFDYLTQINSINNGYATWTIEINEQIKEWLKILIQDIEEKEELLENIQFI